MPALLGGRMWCRPVERLWRGHLRDRPLGRRLVCADPGGARPPGARVPLLPWHCPAGERLWPGAGGSGLRQGAGLGTRTYGSVKSILDNHIVPLKSGIKQRHFQKFH